MATIAALYRHPVKGFTPEPLQHAELTAGGPFPHDRLYAVEDGPSGFDPAAPGHVSKQRFTVLAKLPRVAQVRTAYDDATGVLHATAPGQSPVAADLRTEEGRAAFETWLTAFLDDAVSGPLRVLEGPGAHRFMDHPQGAVSLLNLASVRDLADRLGRPVDPLRFRANVWLEGLEPWVENGWADRELTLGGVALRGFKPIVRCAATHVDPATGEADLELVRALHDLYGHLWCGLYVHVLQSGRIAIGDALAVGTTRTVPA